MYVSFMCFGVYYTLVLCHFIPIPPIENPNTQLEIKKIEILSYLKILSVVKFSIEKPSSPMEKDQMLKVFKLNFVDRSLIRNGDFT